MLQNHQIPHPLDDATIHADTCERWTDPHTCQVSWFHSVCAWVEGSEHYHFTWLISLWGTCEDAVHSLLRWRGMLYDHLGFGLQCLLLTHAEGVLQDMQDRTAAAAIKPHGRHPLLLLEYIGEGDFRKVLSA